MARYSGLATISCTIEGVDYISMCEDFEVTIENQTEDGSGINQRWESAIAVKSRWSGQGTFKKDDSVSSLLVKAASNDVQVTLFLDTGLETVTGDMILTNASNQLRNAALQMVPISLQGVGAPTVTPT